MKHVYYPMSSLVSGGCPERSPTWSCFWSSSVDASGPIYWLALMSGSCLLAFHYCTPLHYYSYLSSPLLELGRRRACSRNALSCSRPARHQLASFLVCSDAIASTREHHRSTHQPHDHPGPRHAQVVPSKSAQIAIRDGNTADNFVSLCEPETPQDGECPTEAASQFRSTSRAQSPCIKSEDLLFRLARHVCTRQ